MSEIRLTEQLAKDRIKEARQRVKQAIRTGEAISDEELAASRGLVLSDRENSIFSDAWLPIAIACVLLGLALGQNLALLSLGLMLLLVVAVGHWWHKRALVQVYYQRELDKTHVFPGEGVQIRLHVYNKKRLPLTWVQFYDPLRGPVRLQGEGFKEPVLALDKYGLTSVFALGGQDYASRQVEVQFPERGFYELGPVTYTAGDVFTLFNKEQTFAQRQTIVVYPQVWPLAELGLPPKEPFGEEKIFRSLFSDPLRTRGIRDYQPQDRFRDVHWKATARRGSLQTKVYDPSEGLTTAVFLNVATQPKHWLGVDPELLERLVAVAASVINYGAEQKQGIGIYANGAIPRSDQAIRVAPSRSPHQLMRCLEALAAVTGFATGSVERLLQAETTRLPWSATLVLVTAVLTPEIIITLVHLREAGRRIALILLAEEPPPYADLGQILCYHIPSSVPAFQPHQTARSLTEAALQAVPAPEPVALQEVGHG
jgi:uncharacterized protein (DUF58 family)